MSVRRSQTEPALRVQGLRFTYPEFNGTRSQAAEPTVVIDDLRVGTGQIAVLIGDNGCGKTTLLKILAGLLVPETGRIDAPSTDASSTGGPCTDAPVLVHQKPYLFAESVFSNVAYPLRIRKVSRDELRRRTLSALETVGLLSFAGRWAPSLSGGETQRVAIARALVLHPSILLLDEPTSNIDAGSVRTIERVLRELAASGVLVVMSTHNMASAYRLADRIVPMAAGRPRPLEVNVFRGTVTESEGEHIGVFHTNYGPHLFCPAGNSGAETAVIRMDDIILSSEEITTSAQNRLHGTVVAVDETEHELFCVNLDCGMPLCCMLTYRSVHELGIVPGRAMHATFKASAVKLY